MSQTTKPAQRGRRTVARHGELRSPHPFSQILKMMAIMVAVVLVSGLGVAAYAAYDITPASPATPSSSRARSPFRPTSERSRAVSISSSRGRMPVRSSTPTLRRPLLRRDAEGELNDVNMLVHISDNPRRVTVISFPRDLMVPIPSCTAEDGSQTSAMSKQMLNSAYTYGGLNCVVQTVAQLTGLDIQYAAKVTWGGVIEITNAIGGVDVCLANGIKDPYTGIDWPAGTRNIQGMDALQFLRTRHGVGNGGDLGRISNQQQYMSRLARKLVSEEVLSNPGDPLQARDTAVDNITPSQTLTNPLTLVQIALAVKNVPFNEIVFIQYPVVDDPYDANRVVPNDSAAEELWAALEANQPLAAHGRSESGRRRRRRRARDARRNAGRDSGARRFRDPGSH